MADAAGDYTERHGGYQRMLAHHRGLGITADQRLRFAILMSRAAIPTLSRRPVG